MGSCKGRHFLLIICVFQLVIVLECQIFDFMGFMYGPILANFFHIIFIILGFFGTFQYSPKYIISYIIWNIFWIGWTAFVICFYLSVGVLDKNSDVLNLGTGSRSWWEIHGFGCLADFTTAIINGSSVEQDPDPSRPPKPTKVEGCLIEYQYVEVIQSSVQCILSILGVSGGCFVCKTYMEEDDSFDFIGGFDPHNSWEGVIQRVRYPLLILLQSGSKGWIIAQVKDRQSNSPLASVNYNYQTARRHLDQYQQQLGMSFGSQSSSPRPMTPRRVKRRSVLARDTMNRSSLIHRRQGSSRSRSSQRRNRPHQNPVTKLLEQQSRYAADSSLASFSDNNRLDLTNTLENGVSPDLLSAGGYPKTGLTNPVFQQSSNSSVNQSGADEIYRPNSARSSYSNYHASRPVSYLHNSEYFPNQAVAQVPINTNRNKKNIQPDDIQNNLQPNLNTTTLKSFSHKNFNFLGFNLKNNNLTNNSGNNNTNNSNNNNNNNNNSSNNNYNCNGNNSDQLVRDRSVRSSKRFRVDLTRNTANRSSNSFFSQGPPAYREGGGLDSETVI